MRQLPQIGLRLVNNPRELFFVRFELKPTICRAVLAENYGQVEDPGVGPDQVLYDCRRQPLGTLNQIVLGVVHERMDKL